MIVVRVTGPGEGGDTVFQWSHIMNCCSWGRRVVRVAAVWCLSPSPSSSGVLGGRGSAAAMARPKTCTSACKWRGGGKIGHRICAKLQTHFIFP